MKLPGGIAALTLRPLDASPPTPRSALRILSFPLQRSVGMV